MKLTFPGTRGSGPVISPRHTRHSILLVETNGTKILLDCGSDWCDGGQQFAPEAILLTHAHDDHSGGLTTLSCSEAWATATTWERLPELPAEKKRTVPLLTPFSIGDITLEAIPVAHSQRAPAVAYRIKAEGQTAFYCPDVADLVAPEQALAGVDLYIGDGSTIGGRLLRCEAGAMCGHAPLAQQIGWCAAAGVPKVLFTHIGEEFDLETEVSVIAELREQGQARNITVDFAFDGFSLSL